MKRVKKESFLIVLYLSFLTIQDNNGTEMIYNIRENIYFLLVNV